MANLDMRDVPFDALIIGQCIGFYIALMPKPADVRNASMEDTKFVDDLRTTEMVAGGLTIAVAVAQAAYTRSPVPLVYAVLMVGAMCYLYEYLMRTRRASAATA